MSTRIVTVRATGRAFLAVTYYKASETGRGVPAIQIDCINETDVRGGSFVSMTPADAVAIARAIIAAHDQGAL